MPSSTSQPETPRPLLEATKVTRLTAPGADVTYVVLVPPQGDPADKRGERRWRTHLRSGKIADGRTCLLVESQVRDRSAGGARLRLSGHLSLPPRIRFFDEISTTLYEATVAWQRGREIGSSFCGKSTRAACRAPSFSGLGSAEISRPPQRRMRPLSKRYGCASSMMPRVVTTTKVPFRHSIASTSPPPGRVEPVSSR